MILFICTGEDWEIILFVLYYCSSLGCMSMPLDPFPTSSTVRGSAAQGADGNSQKGCESPELIKSLPLLTRGKNLVAQITGSRAWLHLFRHSRHFTLPSVCRAVGYRLWTLGVIVILYGRIGIRRVSSDRR